MEPRRKRDELKVQLCAFFQPDTFERLTALAVARKRTPMAPNPDKYRKHVDHFDLTDIAKDELIHTIHVFMESFVDRAFGDDPVQLCIDLKASKYASFESNVIDLEKSEYQSLTQTFNTPKGDV